MEHLDGELTVAYEDLLNSVEESAHEKERELSNKAAAAIDEIKVRAKKQAGEIRKGHLDGAEKSITAERNKQLYLTKAENKELLIKTRETAFEQAFSTAEARLKGLRSDPEYPEVFENLLREAAGSLGNEAFAVHIDPQDEALCRKTLARLGLSSGCHTDIITDGGLVASLPDNSVIISNTVESRLQRIKEQKRKEIHAILSGA
jgi:V/A-type H+/Na+-transporting ATPase subunit E